MHFQFQIESYEVGALVTPLGNMRILQFNGVDANSDITAATLVFSETDLSARIENDGCSVFVIYPADWFKTVYHIVQTEAPVWFGGGLGRDPNTGVMRPLAWGVATDTEVVGEGFSDSDARSNPP